MSDAACTSFIIQKNLGTFGDGGAVVTNREDIEAGIKSVVSHQHRYGDHYRKVKEIIAGGAIGRVHTVYGHATGWMMHMMTHLIEYTRWFNDYAEAEWVAGQAAGREKFTDVHASPDYIAAVIQFVNGVRGVIECGAGAPDVPEVEQWWRKCRIGAQGTEGFEIVMAACRSAVRRGKVTLPLGPGEPELAAPRNALP